MIKGKINERFFRKKKSKHVWWLAKEVFNFENNAKDILS